jgi:hypothetical protein
MGMTYWFRRFIMKLTLKDKDFLERLKSLLESKDLTIELKREGLKCLVLRQNYGDKIENAFGMTRQGVRWRFQRLFNEIYIESYQVIYWIESLFGTELRQKALEIARERVELRKKAQKKGNFDFHRRKTGQNEAGQMPKNCKVFCPPK